MLATKQRKPIKDLEGESIFKASQTIASLFQTPEQLSKLDTQRTIFLQKKTATEAQLKVAMHTQLDGAETGLEKLDLADKEFRECERRYAELSEKLFQLAGCSTSLRELAAAMENMNYLVRVPEAMQEAKRHIEEDRLLDAHKIIQEVEGIRDELSVDLSRFRATDVETVNSYFAGLDELNQMMRGKIEMMGKRLYDFAINSNKLLVDCIRIVDREERADNIWKFRQESSKRMPVCRPKKWKELLFNGIRENIHNQVMASNIATDTPNTKIAVQTSFIKQKTKEYLRLAKNILPIYFPPDYNIFERVVEMFHNVMGKFTEECYKRTDLTRSDYGNLISWLENYYSDDFMKDSYLNIDFTLLDLEYPITLLKPEQRNDLNKRFVQEVSNFIKSYMNRALDSEMNTLKSTSECPTSNSRGKFVTTFPQIVLKTFEDMVGPGKLFSIIGVEVSNLLIVAYVDVMNSFAVDYLRQMKLYRESYLSDRNLYPKYDEFTVAHVYVSEVIAQYLEDMIVKKLGDQNLMLKNQLAMGSLKVMKRSFQEVTNLCLDMLEETSMMDLGKQLNKEWLSNVEAMMNLFRVTIDDYNSAIWSHMDDRYYNSFVERVLESLLIDILHSMLSKRLSVTEESKRIQIGAKLKNEGEEFINFLQMHFKELNPQVLKAYSILKSIGTIIETKEKNIITFDIATLQQEFPDVKMEQLMSIVLIRGDFKLVEVKELLKSINEGMKFGSCQESPLQIFHKLNLRYP
ncbi:Exocyst complex component 3 [Cichlidogyrus casuarinus]|uniref:Exocyst complex component 3 n=1 Tax=Cichlidogyrus casuarinus TaxID=1844966 RepID=A0ABD2Q5R5_9PLAT